MAGRRQGKEWPQMCEVEGEWPGMFFSSAADIFILFTMQYVEPIHPPPCWHPFGRAQGVMGGLRVAQPAGF